MKVYSSNLYQSASGNDFQITTANTYMKNLQLKGNTTQTGTPTPSTPIPIENVTGRQTIGVTGINLFSSDYLVNTVTKNDEATNDFTYTGFWANPIETSGTLKNILKPNTKYTISLKFKVIARPSEFGQYNSDTILGIYKSGGSFLNIYSNVKNTVDLDTWVYVERTVTTPADLTDYRLIAYDFKDTNNTTTGTIEIKELQIQEGETATEFEQFKGNSYEINLGKNLFDINGDFDYGGYDNTPTIINNNLITTANFGTARSAGQHIINLLPNTQYTINANMIETTSTETVKGVMEVLSGLRGNVTRLGLVYFYTTETKTLTITTPSNTSQIWVSLSSYGSNSSSTFTDIQFEKGSTATSYSSFFTPIELNKLSNVYYDFISKMGNDWFIAKCIFKDVMNEYYVLDDTTVTTDTNTTLFTFENQFLSQDALGSVLPKSSYFIGKDVRNVDEEGIYCLGKTVYVRVLNSRLNMNNPLASFGTWLSTHNVDILYARETSYTIQITNTQLINQIEAIQLVKGLNNITITSPNEPLSISFDYFQAFDNNGYGFINDLMEAKVTEQINGDYYLEFKMPLNSNMAQYIEYNNIVKCNVGKDEEQLFRIKRIVKDFNTISVYATHIFYDLIDNVLVNVAPTNLSCQNYGKWLLANTDYPTPFDFSSDKLLVSSSGRYIRKNVVEAMIGNIDNSMLVKFGGEIVRDNFDIALNNHRGGNYVSPVKLLFGKNISAIEMTTDIENMATRIIPVGFDGLMIPEVYVDSPLINNYPYPKMGVVEFSDIKYEPIVEGETPSEDAYHDLNQAYQALRDRVNELYTNGADKPSINIKIDWVELSKTNEYSNYADLERVFIGDRIHAYILGTDYITEIIKTTYNVLTDRIENFEIGTITGSIVTSVNGNSQAIQSFNASEILSSASNTAQQLIINAIGGTYGQIGGFKISSDKLWTEYYPPADFTSTDLDKVRNYILDPVSNPLTQEELELYDLFGDGSVTSKDLLYMTKLIELGITTTNPLKLEMRSGANVMDSAFAIIDGNNNHITDMNINGFNYKGEKANLEVYKAGDTYTEPFKLNVGGFITTSTTTVMFTIPFIGIKDGTATITDGTFVLRGVNGYLNGNQAGATITPSSSGYTFTVDSYNESSMTISIVKSSAFTSATNNTPVALEIQGLEITFS